MILSFTFFNQFYQLYLMKKDELSILMFETQKGNSKSYEILLNKSSLIIRKYLAKRIYNKEELEDVLQEILISIHYARHTFQADKSFTPWLFGIARNQLYKYYSQIDKRKEVPLPEFDLFFKEIENFSNPKIKLLKQKWFELPKKQRLVLEYLKYRGLSIKETAKETGLSVSNVKVIAHRAYEKLRKELNEN